MKLAAIIKHPFRDNDFRVDIYESPEIETKDFENIRMAISESLLGPFEVIAVTSRVDIKETLPIRAEKEFTKRDVLNMIQNYHTQLGESELTNCDLAKKIINDYK
jgi:hypothetical protein